MAQASLDAGDVKPFGVPTSIEYRARIRLREHTKARGKRKNLLADNRRRLAGT
jgi:hypothetical protein